MQLSYLHMTFKTQRHMFSKLFYVTLIIIWMSSYFSNLFILGDFTAANVLQLFNCPCCSIESFANLTNGINLLKMLCYKQLQDNKTTRHLYLALHSSSNLPAIFLQRGVANTHDTPLLISTRPVESIKKIIGHGIRHNVCCSSFVSEFVHINQPQWKGLWTSWTYR